MPNRPPDPATDPATAPATLTEADSAPEAGPAAVVENQPDESQPEDLQPNAEPTGCANCQKPLAACVCSELAPLKTKHHLVILQHPQEKDTLLGTGWLTVLQFPGTVLRVGLSWPNLERAVGRPVDPRRWAVLYLGAAKEFPRTDRLMTVLDRSGQPVPEQDLILPDLDGVILLDATWAQAKTLWWRNPWMLKCRRLVLNPPRRSLYGEARREPRRESLSTLEAAALVVTTLDDVPEYYDQLVRPLERLALLAAGSTPSKPAAQVRRAASSRRRRSPRR